MQKGIYIVLGLLCIPLFVLGFMTIFNPTGMVEKWGVVPDGVNGLNTMRGVVGGLLAGMALLMAIGVWLRDTTWLLAVAALDSVVIFGRLVGIVVDGYDPALTGPLVAEFMILGLALLAHKKAGQASD